MLNQISNILITENKRLNQAKMEKLLTDIKNADAWYKKGISTGMAGQINNSI